MPRCRLWVVAVVVAAALLGSGTPASARDDRQLPRPPSASDDPAPSSTVPGGIDVGHGGDQAGAVAPDTDIDVEPVDPENVNEVLHISTAEAEARRDAIQADIDEVEDHIEQMVADVDAFQVLSADLVVQQRIV